MRNLLFLFLFSTIWGISSQESIGLVFNDQNKEKSAGYTLFTSISDNRVFLIDNCGEVVKEWNSDWGNAPNRRSRMVYLLENGNLLVGSGLDIEIRDWDNNVVWGINYQETFGFRIHHDIEPLPNGNILILVRETFTNTEMFAQGMNVSYPEDTFVLERIIEIEPIGTDSANIVWEWKMFDHLVQEFDSAKPNFGVVADNPHLLDMNYDSGNGSNPIHANSLDYNPELDQILVSSRNLSEIFVIDHSTSTAQAATHTGGDYGMGGDFLWRWGNPEVYDQGTINDRKIERQHDAKWITSGPYHGKISVFSNNAYGNDIAASSIHIIDQGDINGVYNLSSGKFMPTDYHWSYDGVILGEVMRGSTRCGVQIMSNGNALICETDKGRLTEVDNLGNVVWVYIIPTADNNIFNQYSDPIDNGSFRAHRYPEDFPGFDGVTFNNSGIIEDVNSISENCINLLSVENNLLGKISVFPNPTSDVLMFDSVEQVDEIIIYDMSGKIVIRKSNLSSIDMRNLKDGIYIAKVFSNAKQKSFKVVKE